MSGHLLKIGADGLLLPSTSQNRLDSFAYFDVFSARVFMSGFRVATTVTDGDVMTVRQVAEGIDTLVREEAAYRLGMAMHRGEPALAASGVAGSVDHA